MLSEGNNHPDIELYRILKPNPEMEQKILEAFLSEKADILSYAFIIGYICEQSEVTPQLKRIRQSLWRLVALGMLKIQDDRTLKLVAEPSETRNLR